MKPNKAKITTQYVLNITKQSSTNNVNKGGKDEPNIVCMQK